METEEKRFVEAIEEGKIVKVPESYAKREGLIILKKPEIPLTNPSMIPSYYNNELKKEFREDFASHAGKKPGWQEKQVLSELVENFNWLIRMERRKKSLTRKQFSRLINEPEGNLRTIEEGRLPANDFVLINKIQKALGINLRKDKKDFDVSVRDMMEKAQDTKLKEIQQKRDLTEKEMFGDDIEILEDEI